jgi:hypothetical protein
MAGYIGSKASVVSSGAERKKTFTITGATTSLTGLNYTVGKVHVFQNGVRLVDGTDYTATNGTTITLTVAAQNGDNVVVISQASFQVADAVSTSGDSMTGNLSLGDNNKVIFGAGSDLQIYHDGSHSYIAEGGSATGSLRIRGENLLLEDNSGKDYLNAVADAQVELSHNGSKKFETTSTGIAVTGSTAHTAGDITNTISGTYNLNGANGTAGSPAYATYSFKDDPNTGMYRAGTDALAFTTAGSQRMKIHASGAVTKPAQPAFSVTKSTKQSNVATNSQVTVVFDSEVFDQNNDFAGSQFTAPVTGKYQLNLSLYTNEIDSAADYYMAVIKTSNREYQNVIDPGVLASDPVYWNQGVSVLADMDANDTAYVFIQQGNGNQQTDVATPSFFSGYLVA